jgi:glycosyltransferase involved in cell wall biosynthesis
MRILHVSPTYFGDDSVVGGGERYAYELARAMSRRHDVLLLSFAPAPRSARDGGLRVEYLRRRQVAGGLDASALSPGFLRWVRWADVVHCHQVHTLSTNAALILGRLLGKPTFVTDLGGGERYALSYHLPILRWPRAFLLISEYSRRLALEAPAWSRPDRLEVVYGGVDEERFSPGTDGPGAAALFVGRLLSHKGIDILIEAVDGTFTLDVVGPTPDPRYSADLKERSLGKAVRFHGTVGDAELVERYRGALVTVLPSVYEDCYGRRTRIPELLGLAALESLACGTPAIVTDVASLPEIVRDGITGFVVPPNDAKAIRERIHYLAAHPERAREMGQRGREDVLARFTWDAVAARCEAAYVGEGGA